MASAGASADATGTVSNADASAAKVEDGAASNADASAADATSAKNADNEEASK